MDSAALRQLGVRVVNAYRPLGSLSFAYAQGSLVEALSTEADFDLVLVWTTSAPAQDLRVPAAVAEVEEWWSAVSAGGGAAGCPMPAIALHGLTSDDRLRSGQYRCRTRRPMFDRAHGVR